MAEPFSFKEINSLGTLSLQAPEFIKAHDGIDLAYYTFLPDNPKAIVVFYHGAGLYINETYQWVAKELRDTFNIGSYMVDIRGHGYSGGNRGDAPSVESVFSDVDSIITMVKRKFPDTLLFLCGHSSGAGLIINYSAHCKIKQEDGYIFLAPYFGPKSETARVHQGSDVSFIKKVRVWVYILGSIFPRSFAHFKAVFFNYPNYILKKDSLILSSYTYAMSCATTPYEIDGLLKKIVKPVGMFIGEQDEQFIAENVVSYKTLIGTHVEAQIVKDAAHLSILIKAPQLISNFIDTAKVFKNG
jgi:pimeloyl-ACP methyl ester carboxylesterase